MLPLYFKDVITEDQKDQIYVIQNEYRPKIQELRNQMRVLMDEQRQKIRGVLTDEQKAKIDAKYKAAADARKAQKK